MDESAAAVTREDDAVKKYPHNDNGACENSHHPAADNPSEGVGVFCCRDCGAAFREEEPYLEHRLLHPQPNTYLNNQSEAEKDNETSYFCTLCSLSFVEINELHSHLKNHHQTSLKESGVLGLTKDQTFVCSDCGKSFAVIGNFLNHLRSHRQPSKPVFNDPKELKKKPFQCETCGRNYSRASALDAHRRCHEGKLIKSKKRSSGDFSQTGESAVETELNENQTNNDSQKHFECLCGKTFAAESGLKSHQQFSNGQCGSDEVKQIPRKKISEFFCTECNKGFSHRVGFHNHQRWHTNHLAEKFTCEECGKAFTTASFYYRHQRMAHTEETPAKSFLYEVGQVQKKAFECKDCGLKFSRVSAFQSHQLQHIHPFKETVRSARSLKPDLGLRPLKTELGARPLETALGGRPLETELGARPLETELEARPLETALGARPLETELGARPLETELGARPLETELGAQPLETELGTRPLETELGARPLETELEARPLETALGAQTLEMELGAQTLETQPKDQYDSQKHFECLCGKTFAAESGLKSHQQLSSNGQCGSDEMKRIPKKKRCEFFCTECNKGFRYHLGLVNHQRWHTNHFAEKFTCEECGKAFTTASYYYRHQRMAHTEETPAKSFFYEVGQVQKKAFECKDCGMKFSRVSAFQSHQLQHIHPFKETVRSARSLKPDLGLRPLKTELGTRPLETELGARPLKSDLGPLPLETELGPQTVETELRAQTVQTELGIQTLETELGAQTVETELGAQTVQTELGIQTLETELGAQTVETELGPQTVEMELGPQTVETELGIQTLETKLGAQTVETELGAQTVQTVLGPQTVETKLGPQTLEMELGPQTLETELGPQTVEMELGPQTVETELGPQTVETELGPQTVEMELGPQTVEMVLGPQTVEMELGPQTVETELGPQTVEMEQQAQTLETQPRAPTLEIQPRDQPDSQKHFECLCGKTFAAESGLKSHQRFSSNSQCGSDEVKRIPKKKTCEFFCTECNKGFRYRAGLLTHQRWHTNHFAEKFTCEECGKAFTTASYYYRHQRMAHTEETPAKSFLYQVGQVQKKAFECKDCGLKFSRVSAFQSHQLQHIHAFKETVQRARHLELELGPLPLETELRAQTLETQPWAPTLEIQPRNQTLETEQETSSQEVKLVAQTHKALPYQDNIPEGCWKKSEHSTASVGEKVQSELSPAACTMDKSQTNETDEDFESYEPGDFNVQVISDSEPEEQAAPDLNPDLELLCESDQDIRDNTDYEVSPRGLVSKSDLKIIQIDFDQTNKQCAPMESGDENQTAHQRFHCPDCYRWFTNPTSLQVHRMWHGVRKRRQQNQGQSVACEISNYEAQFIHTQFHSDQTLSSDLLNQAEGLVKKTFACNECGNVFSCLSALVSHQLHHPKKKEFQCPDCMMSYLHAASLFNHMKTCSAQKRKDISVSKKEYNPKKTLLGPKIYHCEQCGKGFWSLGAFSHHKQNQMECTDLRLRKGLSSSLHSVNGRSRSVTKVTCPICGRKFRHKGTMALHMRRHENGNHKCEICSRSFRLFSSLLRHEVVHSDQLLPPPIKSFQHQLEQLKKNTYSCPDCGKLFSREKALQFHMKSHGYESRNSPSSPQSMVKVKNLQCATCFAHFNSKASLRAHQKLCRKRDNEVIVEAELAKNEAVKMHSDSNTQEHSSQMKEHVDMRNEGDIGGQQIEMHTDGGNVENPGSTHLKYKCNACDKGFPVAGALNFHKRIHMKGNKSKLKSNIGRPLMFKTPNKDESGKCLIHCSDCGRRFMTKSALGSHRRWHKEKKCSQSSHEEDDFKSVSHKTEDGHFQCKKCEKQFFNHQVLHRHQIFNPLCQTKTEPDLNRNTETDCSEQFSHHVMHCKTLEVAEHQGEPLNPTPEHDVNIIGDETSPSAVKPKPHQCPLCFVTFAKARGLHAHKWQAHPKSRKCKKKLSAKKKLSNSQYDQVEDSEMLKSSTVGEGRKKIRPNPQPEILMSCLDCGEQCSSMACLLDHKKVCSPVKQESKVEVETLEAAAEVPPAFGQPLENTVKCLFKCDKCGKAFRTEEQLGTHKNKAKSRPHCCALCCHGFWTENQLQQHLAWHDEVRCRLPNEVRFRLSAAVTSSPSKPNFPIADKSFPLHTINQPPLVPAGCSETKGQRHGRSEQCSNLYRCLICSKTFSHLKELIDHNKKCTSDHRGQNITHPAAVLGDTDDLNLS